MQNGNEDLVRYLIENGAGIYTRGMPPLIMACKNGNENLVKYLIEMGADVHIKDKK